VSFGFDVDLPGLRCVAASIIARFHGRGTRFDELRATIPGASVWTTRDGTFGCTAGDPLGRTEIDTSGRLDADVLPGVVRVHVTGLGRLRRVHARGAAVRFALPHPDGWPGPEPKTPDGKRKPGVRLCLAADTEHYSRFRVPEAARAQQRFVELLAAARRHAGLGGSVIAVLVDGYRQLDPARFVAVHAEVPTKGFAEPAWLYVPT
jgi:hypothetical protein